MNAEHQQPVRHPEFVPSELPNETDRLVDDETYDRYLKNPEEFAERYLAESGNAVRDEMGNLKSVTINTDDFRPLFKEYTGTNSLAVHRAALAANADLTARLFGEMKGKGNGRILFLGGGSGSGKSSVSGTYYQSGEYPLILDQTGSNYNNLVSAFSEARRYGYGIEFTFVDRSPEAAWQGIVGRALDQSERGEIPRTVNVRYAVESNIRARTVAIAILKSHPEIPVTVFASSTTRGAARIIENREDAIRLLEDQVYNADDIVTRITDDTRRLLERGEIPSHIAEGLIGR